ncbi:MAG: TIGR02453 family protein [Actinomycetota bacterium]|nr:TIGR02453 family protein [Actinomycetota bacterium]
MAKKHFTKGAFDFLRELEANNEKAWWEQNKERYIRVIREPALEFINDFGSRLDKISPEFVADSRTVGGSLMRPYRDVRFSADKTPYKTNVGIQFRHSLGKDVHAPGFYLHLEPGSCFAGAGLWKPEARVARDIRQAIHDDSGRWRKVAKSKTFADTWDLDGGDEYTLKRIPKELEGDHPYPNDLRLKSFIAGAKLTQKQVTAEGFDADLARLFKKAGAFTRFLCDAIGVPF